MQLIAASESAASAFYNMYHTVGAEAQRSDGAAVDYTCCTPTGSTDVVLKIWDSFQFARFWELSWPMQKRLPRNMPLSRWLQPYPQITAKCYTRLEFHQTLNGIDNKYIFGRIWHLQAALTAQVTGNKQMFKLLANWTLGYTLFICKPKKIGWGVLLAKKGTV